MVGFTAATSFGDSGKSEASPSVALSAPGSFLLWAPGSKLGRFEFTGPYRGLPSLGEAERACPLS